MKQFFDTMDEKTRRLLVIAGVLIGLIILLFIIIGITKGANGGKITKERLEKIMTEAAEKYFAEEKKLPREGKTSKVTTTTLANEGYMKDMSKYTNEECSGSVAVSNNADEYLYMPYLKCEDYKTSTLANVIKADVTTSEDGSYKVGSEYIYKGEFVKNYVSFSKRIWRIVKLDTNGNVQLIGSKPETTSSSWDDRYNTELKQKNGINDYKLSRIKTNLEAMYENEKVITKNARKYIINHDWCTDKINSNNLTIKEVTCTTTDKAYFGLITPYEYVSGSFDKNCTSYDSKSCGNYNYLSKIASNYYTITADSKDTASVYSVSNGAITKYYANYYNSILISLYINGNANVSGGTGTLNDPFIIKDAQ